MTAWFIQLGLNFIWSPVFFGAHRIGLALAIIVALLAAILTFIVAAWPRDHVASWLFVPYAAWWPSRRYSTPPYGISTDYSARHAL